LPVVKKGARAGWGDLRSRCLERPASLASSKEAARKVNREGGSDMDVVVRKSWIEEHDIGARKVGGPKNRGLSRGKGSESEDGLAV